MYGAIDPVNQNCHLVKEARNNSNNLVYLDTVTVCIPLLPQTESEFCFVARGTTASFTIAVEGTFKLIGTHMHSSSY